MSSQSNNIAYPRISIEYCTKCRWSLRAVWYLQELFATFSDGGHIGEIALQPGGNAVFVISVQTNTSPAPVVIWDRKEKGGFPDIKELKQLVRDIIAPDLSLGHSDKK